MVIRFILRKDKPDEKLVGVEANVDEESATEEESRDC